MHPLRHKKPVQGLLITLLLFTVSIISVAVVQNKLLQEQQRYRTSIVLADALRQTSDDLTRMVRTYAVTMDESYKKQFLEVLTIRDGQSPRPEKFNQIYWDLVTDKGERPYGFDKAVSLTDLMIKAGFTKAEFSYLKEAKANSDALAVIEQNVMDKLAMPSHLSAEDHLALIASLHDKTYHKFKAGIMEPIFKFQQAVALRNQQSIDTVRKALITFECLSAIFFLMAGYFSFALIQQERNKAKLLEEEVARRTDDLEKAVTAADEANQAKGQFLSNMSHEIRTPINAIYGSLQLLSRESYLKNSHHDLVMNGLRSSEVLLEIVNEILDMSKLDANKLKLEAVDFTFLDLVEDVHGSLLVLAEEKGVELTIDVHSSFVDGWQGDPLRIRQILMNLLSNGIKFTKQGKVTIKVGKSTTRGGLHFSVKDTGIGISDDIQQKIFMPFEQGDLSATRKFGGTGLGLVIVKSFVDMMKGTIKVKSDLGKGAEFSVYLPLPAVALSHQDDQAETKVAIPNLKGKTIVVAEDNPINKMILEAMLKETEATLYYGSNGQEAIDLCRVKKPDLIMLDIHMPVMDGLEACKILHADYPSIPIVAVTADMMQEGMDVYKDCGFVEVIGKPINVDDLYRFLGETF